jgi:hypothetical protein
VRFYSNENFPRQAVEALRALGHDVLTTPEALKAGLSDPEVLKYATENHRVVLTHNWKHFVRLHNDNANHCGVVVARTDIDFERLARRVHEAVSALANPAGQLIMLSKP